MTGPAGPSPAGTRIAAALAALALAGSLVACTADPPGAGPPTAPAATGTVVAPLPDDHCGPDDRYVERAVTGGARWRFCWTVDATAGPVLRDLAYAPPGGRPFVPVLAETHLAEVYMVYDSGTPRGHDTDTGFGTLKALSPAECPGGTVYASPVTFGKGVLCVTTAPAGYSWVQAQTDTYLMGEEVTVFAVAQVEWYSYVVRWTLRDDGSLLPALGASGTLRPDSVDDHDHDHGSPLGPGQSRLHTNHFHQALWRMRFPHRPAGYRISQVDVQRRPDDTYVTRRDDRPTEFAAHYAGARSWLVSANGVDNADGHPATWELPSQTPSGFASGRPDERFLLDDVHLTRHHDCERLVRAGTGCPGRSLDRYVDGEQLTDPVMWVAVGFHHVPRDEDADPMPTHWQGFSLLARDVQDRNGLGRR